MPTMQSTPAAPNAPVYSTVQQFSEKHPAFTVGSMRALIFNASTNGLSEAGAIVRIGRKVLLNDTKFYDWLEGYFCPSPRKGKNKQLLMFSVS